MRQTQPQDIDKFNQSVIDHVIKDVMQQINLKNQGQAFTGEHDMSHGGYEASFDPDNFTSAQNNMIDNEGQLIGDQAAVKLAMDEFKSLWKENLRRHCDEAASFAQ